MWYKQGSGKWILRCEVVSCGCEFQKKNVFKFSCDLAQWHEEIVPWEIHMDLIKIKSIKANLIKQIIKLS